MVNHAIIGNNALVTGSVLYENDDLQYLMGVGKRYFFANTEYNRLFEGNLYYTLGTPEPTSGPSQRPSSSPSLRPTKNPSVSITFMPSASPHQVISLSPSFTQSIIPSFTTLPSQEIIIGDDFNVTEQPSNSPSQISKSASPSFESSSAPSVKISQNPSILASTIPSSHSTSLPTSSPSFISKRPSSSPSNSHHPTDMHLVLPLSNYNGDILNYGNMFEIIAFTDIVVRAFDIHADAGDDILHELQIYNRPTSLGAIRSPGAWNKISRDALYIACERKLSKYNFTLFSI